MKYPSLFFAALFVLGCSANSPSPDAGDTPAGAMPVSETRADTLLADANRRAPVEARAPASAKAEVDTRCSRDSDCAVKNVGNCCGYFPACVNKDSPTFPEQVKLQCEKEGTMGICGFREIAGCMCVEGRCAASDGVQ
ncbi:MAG TPA: hypothetical protein VND91_03800 [Candidatus Saccharimonadia bacterium]|nr:hypothetical protein [Candidatus Saccharimonadia bacterium]